MKMCSMFSSQDMGQMLQDSPSALNTPPARIANIWVQHVFFQNFIINPIHLYSSPHCQGRNQPQEWHSKCFACEDRVTGSSVG